MVHVSLSSRAVSSWSIASHQIGCLMACVYDVGSELIETEVVKARNWGESDTYDKTEERGYKTSLPEREEEAGEFNLDVEW